MTKIPVSFLFSSTDAVLELATLLEDLAQAESMAQNDRGDSNSADVSERKVNQAYEWAKVLRDFAAGR